MVDALAQGDRIEIRGFGSFVVKHRRARQGRNPKSGALVSVAAKECRSSKSAKSCVCASTASLTIRAKTERMSETALGALADGLYQ